MPMKNILSNALARLTGLFTPKTQPRTAENRPSTTPDQRPTNDDDIQFCGHPRHGAFPVRRKYKASGVSAHGHKFVVFQCPNCGEFVARTLDPVTGCERILFRGKYYRPNFNSRRDSRHSPIFRPVRAAGAAN